MIPIELPSASGMRPLHFTVLTITIAILALAYLTYVAARWTGYLDQETPWAVFTQERHLHIGESSFSVPENLLRAPATSLSLLTGVATVQSFRLAVVWPNMKTAKNQNAQSNANAAAAGNLILVDVSARKTSETMWDRLDPVYRRLARGQETNGPAGLKILTLSSAIALEKDQIVFEPTRTGGFIARCRQSSSEPAFCTREIRFGNDLTVTYRFSQVLLVNWGRLDRKVAQLVASMKKK